ncbi:alpha/beta fold hydrolase [Amycolatopsis sp. NPDC058278]|uniref:alpha/beta fold hydrolase n=1 Tax=Amycolatopsis sp. NPDC058278 TaxID=3346417 RepID=UPI0036D807C6
MTISGFSCERIPVGDAHPGVAHGGAGPPVVLLHGFPQTHLAWRHVAGSLARDHRVICPDLRGYGGSDKPPGDYSKRRMAADVVALARALGYERFAPAGHDRGALVAFRAALDHPSAVSHLAGCSRSTSSCSPTRRRCRSGCSARRRRSSSGTSCPRNGRRRWSRRCAGSSPREARVTPLNSAPKGSFEA